MRSNDKIILGAAVGLVLVLIGLYLSQKPNCNRGCKTMAEHLLTDGLEQVVAALLA
jgi:uncharacterized protein YjeT (DUF2065 family)